ncbi:MAG: hypothetical protein FJW38_13975 [Acidobacteria bacterium]|nr:hypothetical protein [Acidobacteriota bacterium]
MRTLLLFSFAIVHAATPLDEMAWIAGHWHAKSMWGGTGDEIYSVPSGGSIIGLFRYVKDGKLNLTEILHYEIENGNVILRLKHFEPGLKGREEKNDSVEFKQTDRKDGEFSMKAELKGMTITLVYKRVGKDRMDVVMIREQAGKQSEETTVFTRLR